MKTAAVRVLALAALLAGAARAHLTVNTHVVHEPHGDVYSQPYGEDIILHCSSNSTDFEIQVKKPNIGEYTYSCTQNKTTDSEPGDSLTVKVTPAVSVRSPKSVYNLSYFVPIGEDYEVFCSGNDAAALSIVSNEEQLQTAVVNGTTIVYKTQSSHYNDTRYRCVGKGAMKNGEEADLFQETRVIVDYYPEALNFQCIVKHYGAMQALECAWSYRSGGLLTFELRANGRYLADYRREPGIWGTQDANFRVERFVPVAENQTVPLLLMTCNAVFCNNQIFSMNVDVISPGSPVEHVEKLNSTSDSVLVAWDCYENRVYKVEYALVEEHLVWRRADASPLRVGGGRCELTLALLRADAAYLVRVYARHAQATDDRLWSSPRSISVQTEPEDAELEAVNSV